MHLYSAITFPFEVVMKALSWTLFHSLWQGLLLSLIAGFIIVVTRKSNPLLRYNLLALTLVIFVTGVAATFLQQFTNITASIEPSKMRLTHINTAEPSLYPQTITTQSSFTDKAVDFLNTNAFWIVLIWLLIIGYKFVRLSSSLYYMHQLKRTQVSSPGDYWNNKMTELCRQLQVNKNVQLLQSTLVRIPAVIGHLKPVILFPAVMLSSMPLQEVEAVLIHELAHIRRKDFVVNLIQSIVEIIFFFNPAVLWVSSLIKEERENCCDDIAVINIGSKQNYIQALISFQEFNLPANQQLAIAFAGEKNHLLSRVKRMIYQTNNTLNNMEKKFLSAGIVLLSICLFAFVSGKETKINILTSDSIGIVETPKTIADNRNIKSNPFTSHTNLIATKDTVPVYKIGGGTNMTGVTHTYINGKEYRIIIENSIVTELYIDGKKIPAEKIIDYKSILDKHYAKMIMNREKSLRDSEQSRKDSEQSVKDAAMAARDSEQARKDSEQSVKDAKLAARDSEQARKDSEQSVKDAALAARDSEQARKDNEQSVKDAKLAARDSEQARKAIEQSAKDSEQAGHTAYPVGSENTDHSDHTMNKIIDELIANKIIKNRKSLYSLQLNAVKLVVNGVTQPSDVHRKFTNQFEVSNTWSWYYETR